MPRSDIPMGSEFGPNQVDLIRVLKLAQEHEGNGQEFIAAIGREYSWPLATAKNTRLSMRKYGLLEEDDRLTEEGQKLLGLQSQPDDLYEEFARHILLHLHGIDVVNAIDTLLQSGEPATQLTIGEFLKAQGIYVSTSSTHISKLCAWLKKAGVFRADGAFDTLDMERVSQLIGATQDETDLLSEMPEDQRAILKALCNLPLSTIEEPILSSRIMRYTEVLYGVTFNPKSFPREVLEPLVSAGYISIQKQAKATGEEANSREQFSGKPYVIYRTEKFLNEHLEALIDALANTGLAVRQLLRKSLAEILEELNSENTGVKGKALEALAFYLMRLIGLEFKSWRKRGKKTSGFEVDVIVEGARLVFSRWQIQCKNTPDSVVPLEDIAKEVGLSLQLQSNVILVVTTGRFSRDALTYADDMMKLTHLNIVTLNREDLRRLSASPLAIIEILERKARRVMELKALPEN
jgi:site-specific DNA-methyltransferase (cytosine-N4-specific)